MADHTSKVVFGESHCVLHQWWLLSEGTRLTFQRLYARKIKSSLFVDVWASGIWCFSLGLETPSGLSRGHFWFFSFFNLLMGYGESCSWSSKHFFNGLGSSEVFISWHWAGFLDAPRQISGRNSMVKFVTAYLQILLLKIFEHRQLELPNINLLVIFLRFWSTTVGSSSGVIVVARRKVAEDNLRFANLMAGGRGTVRMRFRNRRHPPLIFWSNRWDLLAPFRLRTLGRRMIQHFWRGRGGMDWAVLRMRLDRVFEFLGRVHIVGV